ncbi:MAG: FprA family A-type flavoprotein, partial [Rikenellaceae bacterium]|nr:FprA family A-type flavoprotein [Rikenellaceae bacterium]
YGIKDKVLGLFGSYSWNGGGVRNLKCFAEAASLPLVAEAVDMPGKPDADKLAACDAMAAAVAAAVLE